MILRSRMVSSGDATTMLLDRFRGLYCSAHGEHMSWTPFTEKPRLVRPEHGTGSSYERASATAIEALEREGIINPLVFCRRKDSGLGRSGSDGKRPRQLPAVPGVNRMKRSTPDRILRSRMSPMG